MFFASLEKIRAGSKCFLHPWKKSERGLNVFCIPTTNFFTHWPKFFTNWLKFFIPLTKIFSHPWKKSERGLNVFYIPTTKFFIHLLKFFTTPSKFLSLTKLFTPSFKFFLAYQTFFTTQSKFFICWLKFFPTLTKFFLPLTKIFSPSLEKTRAGSKCFLHPYYKIFYRTDQNIFTTPKKFPRASCMIFDHDDR